jgi:hypothetical protein
LHHQNETNSKQTRKLNTQPNTPITVKRLKKMQTQSLTYSQNITSITISVKNNIANRITFFAAIIACTIAAAMF